jgi:hypothetical protein
VLFQMSGFARNRRRAVDKWKKLGHSVSACSGQNRVEQNSVGICEYVMFNSGFAPICRTLACFFAPTYRANCAAVDRGHATNQSDPTSSIHVVMFGLTAPRHRRSASLTTAANT